MIQGHLIRVDSICLSASNILAPLQILLYKKSTLNFTVIVLKAEQFGFYSALMHPRDAAGMANSVDPDQNAPHRSSLIWGCTVCSDVFIPILRIFSVVRCSNFRMVSAVLENNIHQAQKKKKKKKRLKRQR